jgi:hypothetical protein
MRDFNLSQRLWVWLMAEGAMAVSGKPDESTRFHTCQPKIHTTLIRGKLAGRSIVQTMRQSMERISPEEKRYLTAAQRQSVKPAIETGTGAHE